MELGSLSGYVFLQKFRSYGAIRYLKYSCATKVSLLWSLGLTLLLVCYKNIAPMELGSLSGYVFLQKFRSYGAKGHQKIFLFYKNFALMELKVIKIYSGFSWSTKLNQQ
jgi:hypothetical protein